ncbi:MAG: PIN domain-containing protein [Verrucomicrobiales bacterium]|nr:PIN domain-containing protein [Verrucomicrobiales bacterium]
MVLVDSSVWIESLRRKGRLDVKVALEGLLEAYEAQWCSPVRLEVLGGARLDERRRLGLHFSVIPYRVCGEKDWDNAVSLAWKLRDRGLTIPWNDVLIAAIALRDDVRLYAIDAHFEAVAEIAGLKLYEPGVGGTFRPEMAE